MQHAQPLITTTKALLFHEVNQTSLSVIDGSDSHNPSLTKSITIHSIKNTPSGSVMGAGRLMSEHDKNVLRDYLNDDHSQQTQWLPENLLCLNEKIKQSFIYGDKKGAMTNTTRIYNKVGLAYGTATDVAYVKDRNGIEFFLTATILTNKNEIFNDNTYEYDQLGIPFLAALGRELYQFEKNKNSVK